MRETLALQHVHFRYSGIGASKNDILRDVTLSFGGPECVAIVGQSGSGKTTLIQHFTGLLRPTRGTVAFDGRDIWAKGFKQSVLRRKSGLVFQFPENKML